ncbi:restriction endonuclease subunit S [Agromyces binzhouensis]|nr:restriction endonuclease subunit S [Agromyces binzhouensis]
MRDGWKQAVLAEVLTEIQRPVPVSSLTEVRFAGVRWYAEGVYARETVRAGEVKTATVTELRSGDITYNRMWATKASFGLVGDDVDGCHVTNDFPIFEVNEAETTGRYVELIFQTTPFQAEAAARATGTTERRRLKQRDFLSIPIVLPKLAEQRRAVDLITALDEAIEAAGQEAEAAHAALEDVRDLLIWGRSEVRVALREVAAVVGRLVSPMEPEFASLPHIGTDRIESGTGVLHGVISAAQDRVISGKYLHEPRTVIYSKIRPNLRKVAVPDWRGLCSADAYPLLPLGSDDVDYLSQLLISRPFTAEAVSRSGRTKMPKINRADLMSIEVPSLDSAEQAKVSTTLSSLSNARDAARATAQTLGALRANLLTVILSGEHEIPATYDALLEEVA